MPVQKLRTWCGSSLAIIRAVPLPAVAKNNGMTVLSVSLPAADTPIRCLGRGHCGQVTSGVRSIVPAQHADGLFFGLLDVIADEVVAASGDPQNVRKLIASLFFVLGQKAQASDLSFDQLRQGHSTLGGLHEALYRTFIQQNGGTALKAAMKDTLERIKAMQG